MGILLFLHRVIFRPNNPKFSLSVQIAKVFADKCKAFMTLNSNMAVTNETINLILTVILWKGS